MRLMSTSLLLLLAAPALAQDATQYNAHGFSLAPGDNDLHDYLGVFRSERQVAGSFGANGLLEYAKSPLVLVSEFADGSQTRDPLLDNLFGLNIGISGAPHERIAVGLTAPVFFTSSGRDGAQGAAFGDMRLYVPVGLLLPNEDRTVGSVGVSIIPYLDLPTGANKQWLGNSGVGGGGLLAAGLDYRRLNVSANVGANFTPAVAFENLNGGPQLLAQLGASVQLIDWLAVRAEANLRPALQRNELAFTESPGEAMLSLRGRHTNGVSWTVGGASAISPGASAAAFRIFAGGGWTFGKDKPKDADLDGIVDKDDVCKGEPETQNGHKDSDGCPDGLSDLTFTVRGPTGAPLPGAKITVDGVEKGVTDEKGQVTLTNVMPGTPIKAKVEPFKKTGIDAGDFAEITLNEGSQNQEIQLPWKPGAVKVVTKSNTGAIVDSSVNFRGPEKMDDAPVGDDGEEIFVLAPGDWTLYVSAPSFGIEKKTLNIKPDQRSLVVIEVELKPAIVETTTNEVVILQAIEFDFDKATIKDVSKPLLNEVALNLQRYDQIKKVQVQGHTDSKGNDKYNKTLSQKRVDAVVAYLGSQGVEASRLTPVGYGEACPAADNGTDAGRATNRRVQFFITDPAPADGVPCENGKPASMATPTTTIEVKKTLERPTEAPPK